MRRLRRPRDPDQEFAGAVRDACGRMGLTVVRLDLERVELLGRINGTVALEDVRAACDLEPMDRWTAVVLDALQGLAVSLETPVDLTDAEAVRPLLRVRLYAEGALLADDVVRRPVAAGLVEVLVAEVSGAVRQVPPAVVAGWGVPEDELFELGRRQVLAAGLLARRALDLGGVAVTVLESTSAFAATHVHWLGSYVDVPPAGLLVALPTRHLVLCTPLVTRAATLDAAQALLVNADLLWREGPGGLSPDLWWWRDGQLVLLPGTATSLSPPASFLTVLDALPG